MSENKLKSQGIMSQGYGVISKLVMRDKGLSVEAKAIYSYLVSFAGAGDTSYPSVKLMCSDLGISTNRFYRHRKMLEEKGYIIINKKRNDTGFENNIYTLPINPCIRFEDTQIVYTQNEDIQNEYTNNINSNNNNSNNNKPNKKDWFEDFLKSYPKKVSKGQAEKTFDKTIEDVETLNLILKDLEKRKHFEGWKKDNGKYIPNPSTYLNGKRWLDEYKVTKKSEDLEFGVYT